MKSNQLIRLAGATFLGALVFALSPALSAQSASAYVTSGLDKYRMGDFDAAIADYTKAIDLNSSSVGAYNYRGMARSKQGNFEGAKADYAQALKLKPNFVDAFFNRGTAELLQGNLDGAIADYSKAIELKPDHLEAYFHRGLARDGQSNFEGASGDYAKALELGAGKDDVDANYRLLHSALLSRRMGHGIDERLKAAAGWGNEWTKALGLFLSDKMSEADLKALAAAAGGDQKTNQQNDALYFTGVVRLAAGDKAAARADFQQCFEATGPASLLHRLARSELDRN
jgi:tetratricopeptide (TPR) repeat protein